MSHLADESQYIGSDNSSTTSPSLSPTSPTNDTTVLSESEMAEDESKVQVSATQYYDGDDSLRSHVDESQLDEVDLVVPQPENDGHQSQDHTLSYKTSQKGDDQRLSVITSTGKQGSEPFQRYLSASIDNVGDDFMFPPGQISGSQSKHKPFASSSTKDQRSRDDSSDLGFQAPMIKVRGGNSRDLFLHQTAPEESTQKSRSSTTKIKTSHTEEKQIQGSGMRLSKQYSLNKSHDSDKHPLPSDTQKKDSKANSSIVQSLRPTISKPPVPPFPQEAIQTGNTSKIAHRKEKQDMLENKRTVVRPGASYGVSSSASQPRFHDKATVDEISHDSLDLPHHNPSRPRSSSYKSDNNQSTPDLQILRQNSRQPRTPPTNTHHNKAFRMPATKDINKKSSHRIFSEREDFDAELPRALTPPRRPLSVVSTAISYDQEAPQTPTALSVFQWGFEMLRDEKEQAMSRDIAIRDYNKRIDALTNKYCISNHKMQESIEARVEAEKKIERLRTGAALTRGSLARIDEGYRSLCSEVQNLRGQDEAIVLKFREYQSQSQGREEEIRTHYSKLLREEATGYGKDLERLQEVEDTLRAELEVRTRELQEQRGMVEQARKHIEEEKNRYIELKNQLNVYESNVSKKLDANSTAFNDLVKSYESRQSRFDEKFDMLQSLRPTEYPSEIANLPSLVASLNTSINDRLSNVEKDSSESRLNGNELNIRFQTQMEAMRKDQEILNQLNCQIAELRVANEAQSTELEKYKTNAERLQEVLTLKDQELSAARSANERDTTIAEDLQISKDRNMKLEKTINGLKKQVSERNDKIKLTDQTNDRLKEDLNTVTLDLQRQQAIYESSFARDRKELEELYAKEIADLTAQMTAQIQKQKDELTTATGDRDRLSLQLYTTTKNNEAQAANYQLLREELDGWVADKSAFDKQVCEALSQVGPSSESVNQILDGIRDIENRVDALALARAESLMLQSQPEIENQPGRSSLGRNKRPFDITLDQQTDSPKRQKIQYSQAQATKFQPAKVQTGGLRSRSRIFTNAESSKVDHPKPFTLEGKGHPSSIRSFAEVEGSNGDEEQPSTKTGPPVRRNISYTTLKPPQEDTEVTSRHFGSHADKDDQNPQQSNSTSNTPADTSQVSKSAPFTQKTQSNTTASTGSSSARYQNVRSSYGRQGASKVAASFSQPTHLSSPPKGTRRRERRNSTKSVSFSKSGGRTVPKRNRD